MGVIRIIDASNGIDFIGSRQTGEKIRKNMELFFDKKESVTLDFVNVRSITQSFTDEVIGIFVRAYGIDFIKKNVRIVNYNEDIRQTFNYVASYSKRMSA